MKSDSRDKLASRVMRSVRDVSRGEPERIDRLIAAFREQLEQAMEAPDAATQED